MLNFATEAFPCIPRSDSEQEQIAYYCKVCELIRSQDNNICFYINLAGHGRLVSKSLFLNVKMIYEIWQFIYIAKRMLPSYLPPKRNDKDKEKDKDDDKLLNSIYSSGISANIEFIIVFLENGYKKIITIKEETMTFHDSNYDYSTECDANSLYNKIIEMDINPFQRLKEFAKLLQTTQCDFETIKTQISKINNDSSLKDIVDWDIRTMVGMLKDDISSIKNLLFNLLECIEGENKIMSNYFERYFGNGVDLTDINTLKDISHKHIYCVTKFPSTIPPAERCDRSAESEKKRG